jgi:hypothetical protein
MSVHMKQNPFADSPCLVVEESGFLGDYPLS